MEMRRAAQAGKGGSGKRREQGTPVRDNCKCTGPED